MNGSHPNDTVKTGLTGMNALPLVSIVVLNWNGKKLLEQFLPFVLASTYPNKKVIVADNASTDDSVVLLQQNFPQVEILINDVNEGFAKGYNTALKQITSDYYILLNNDVEPQPGWIEPVIELMEKDVTIAACQPKVLAHGNRGYFEYAGACGGWLDRFGYPFARGRVFDILEKDRGQYDNAAPCFWATGAAMFVKAAIYHRLGGLDEYFFAHQEEIDLCWRVQLAGYKVYVQPQSVVYHVGAGTLAKESSFKTYLNFRNNLIMLAKNLSLSKAVGTIIARVVLDAIAAWKGLLAGKAGYFLAILKAHIAFLKWLLFDRQRSVFPVSRKGDVSGWYSSLLVWQYFIKKKNVFSEIVRNK